jgi:hypothetical protein
MSKYSTCSILLQWNLAIFAELQPADERDALLAKDA